MAALQVALLQKQSLAQQQPGVGAVPQAQAGLASSNAAAQQQLQQAASLEALLKLERLRQSQQVQAQQHQAACLISQLAQQGSANTLSQQLIQQQIESQAPAAKSSSGTPAATLPGVVGTPNNANVILQQLWEQQQRAVLLAMLQQQQQRNLQQLLSTIAMSSAGSRQAPVTGLAAGSPASGAASPVSGFQSPFGGSQSPVSGSRSPLAASPSHSGPSSPRALATPFSSKAAFTTPTHPSSRPPLAPCSSKDVKASHPVAAAPGGRIVQRLASRASPKGVHEFDWDQSPSTSPRNAGDAGKASGEDEEEREGMVDLPSEEEFESHLFGVQLSFM